jgi:uncharacterized membrane protein YphA (DoxX/SURF4 family)
MINLSTIGRTFYGISLIGMGFLAIYYGDLPYMLIPAGHSWIPGLAVLAYFLGSLLTLAGLSIVLAKKTRVVSLLLGALLLFIFCFCFIPYQLLVSTNYKHFWDWENAAKELAFCSGAFVIAGSFSEKCENRAFKFLGGIIVFGPIFFAISMISFAFDHFLYSKEVADYVPRWIANPIFWIYFAGVALFGSGIAIIVNFKPRLVAILLGSMIFIWFIILHIPYVISSSFTDRAGEAASAFLALGYSGIAFVIAGSDNKMSLKKRYV